ncbi:hypothetical protein SAMN05421766_11150 [Zobellia uliginosa]|uniref:Uncharacterized protein n=1 Tax=Zobellia uliginosa TaxID=143224 RepID=A0ABY1L272_9FLAO|nr:hypothetical protein SAMN05421766_11150 [Zobellia uliginosa]
MFANDPGYERCRILKPLSCMPTVILFSWNVFIFKESARICYGRCACCTSMNSINTYLLGYFVKYN